MASSSSAQAPKAKSKAAGKPKSTRVGAYAGHKHYMFMKWPYPLTAYPQPPHPHSISTLMEAANDMGVYVSIKGRYHGKAKREELRMMTLTLKGDNWPTTFLQLVKITRASFDDFDPDALGLPTCHDMDDADEEVKIEWPAVANLSVPDEDRQNDAPLCIHTLHLAS